MFRHLWLGALAAVGWTAIFGATLAPAQSAPSSVAAVEPFLDDQAFAVVRIDSTQIVPRELARFFEPVAELHMAPSDSEKRQLAVAEAALNAWREAGGEELYFVASLADGPPSLFAVAPASSEEVAKRIAPLFEQFGFEAQEAFGKSAVAGSRRTLERLKSVRPAAQPDLRRALAIRPKAAVQAGIGLPSDLRRVIRELDSPLPPEAGAAGFAELTAPVRWIGLAIDAPPEVGLQLTIQADSADGAAKVRGSIDRGLLAAGLVPDLKPLAPLFLRLSDRISNDGEQVVLKLDRVAVEKLLRDELAAPALAARQAARRSNSMGHLKQIGLAFHNYHDVHGKFPPAASRDKNGKPLLSWRVHLLPYLEQKALYDRFKLDEPWDSPHNKPLSLIVPSVYVSPGWETLAKDGKTRYLAPVGPKSVFESPEGTPIQKITDGTSNTLLVMESAPERAVVWTQPADWEFDKAAPEGQEQVSEAAEWLALFCDGSVRSLKTELPAVTLLRILQMNDGHPVDLK